MGANVRGDQINEINKERESNFVQCVVDDMSVSNDAFVVLPLGGAHNLSQEIKEYGQGTGYIVLTPENYPDQHINYSLD